MKTDPANQLEPGPLFDFAQEIFEMVHKKHLNNIEVGRLYGFLIAHELIAYKEVKKSDQATDAFMNELATEIALLAPYVTLTAVPQSDEPESSPMDERDIGILAQKIWRVMRPHRMSRYRPR